MHVPTHLERYNCSDYFESEFATNGYWHEASYLNLIVSATEFEENPELDFLMIGRPGVDGILFGYRADKTGLWAYYPIRGTFTQVASTTQELVDKWVSGELTV